MDAPALGSIPASASLIAPGEASPLPGAPAPLLLAMLMAMLMAMLDDREHSGSEIFI